MRSSRCF